MQRRASTTPGAANAPVGQAPRQSVQSPQRLLGGRVVGVDRAIDEHHRQRQPRPEPRVDEAAVLADPAQPRALGPGLLHRHAGVDGRRRSPASGPARAAACAGPSSGRGARSGSRARARSGRSAPRLAGRAVVGDRQRDDRRAPASTAVGSSRSGSRRAIQVHVGGVAGRQPALERLRIQRAPRARGRPA